MRPPALVELFTVLTFPHCQAVVAHCYTFMGLNPDSGHVTEMALSLVKSMDSPVILHIQYHMQLAIYNATI